MANPQKENGYTPVANEILEQICKLKLNGTQYKILLIVWRFTYGFSRKEHGLSEGFISRAIETDKRQTRRELNELINLNIVKVLKEATFTTTRVISFNKHYNQWNIERPQRVKELGEGELDHSPEGEKAHSPEGELDHQENNIKTNIKQATPRPQKHKYGEYQHVLLTDDEKDRLISEYGEGIFNRCIKKLDEYIEVKKPKYDNHNLVIRKWVIKAVQEDGDKLPDNMNRTEKAVLPATTEPEEEPIDLWSD